MDKEKCRNKALKTAANVKGIHHANPFICLQFAWLF